MTLFLFSSEALSSPTLGTCACQAVMVCTGERERKKIKRWDEGIVGQTVVVYQKNSRAALVLPFLTCKGNVIFSVERCFV